MTTGADGRAGFLLRLPQGIQSRDSVTATATDPGGNSSEFSPPVDAPALVISWNAGTGNWNNAANWSPAQLPAAGDDVVIGANGSNTTFTVTLDVNATVNSLNLGGGSGTQTLAIASPTLTLNAPSTVNANGILRQSGGTIAGNGSLIINGTYNWSGGLMTGAGVTTVNGPFNLSGLVAINANRTLNNASTANWTSANGLGMRTGSGSIINNTGTWDAQTDGAAIVNYYGGATTFNNSGTFRKSAGTGTSSITILFTNTGTVDVQSGTLSLGANGSSTAALNVSGASATLLFAAGVFDLNAGTTVTGPGTVLLNSSGTLNVNTAVTIPAATTLTFLAGTLAGTGTLTSNGTFNWSGGLMTGAGVTTVNGPFNLSGLVAINGNRTLNNASTANWTSANGLGMRTGSGSVINNTGTWDAQTDGAAIVNYYLGATSFNNSGHLQEVGRHRHLVDLHPVHQHRHRRRPERHAEPGRQREQQRGAERLGGLGDAAVRRRRLRPQRRHDRDGTRDGPAQQQRHPERQQRPLHPRGHDLHLPGRDAGRNRDADHERHVQLVGGPDDRGGGDDGQRSVQPERAGRHQRQPDAEQRLDCELDLRERPGDAHRVRVGHQQHRHLGRPDRRRRDRQLLPRRDDLQQLRDFQEVGRHRHHVDLRSRSPTPAPSTSRAAR